MNISFSNEYVGEIWSVNSEVLSRTHGLGLCYWSVISRKVKNHKVHMLVSPLDIVIHRELSELQNIAITIMKET